MRRHGPATTATGLGLNDHLCWAFDDDDALRDGVVGFLRDGLDLGQRLFYVTDRPRRTMLDDLAALDVAGLLAADRLRVHALDELYDTTESFDADRQLSAYQAAIEAAVADGWSGLRVAADASPLVSDPDGRWERLAEDAMGNGLRMAAMCGYDRRQVPADVVDDMTAAHPLSHDRHAPAFQLFSDGPRWVLSGVVESTGSGRLGRLLRAGVTSSRTEVRLNVAPLEFIDASGMRTLAMWGAKVSEGGPRVTISGATSVVRRAWRALRFDELEGVRLAEAEA